MRSLYIVAFLTLFTDGAIAQDIAGIPTPGPTQWCFPRELLMNTITKQFKELLMWSGLDAKSKIPFSWYVNFEAKTSSFVTFPQDGIACVTGGENVILPRAEDL